MFKNTIDNKRYYTLNCFYKNKFNTKVCKISLNAGFSCPNLDGKVGYGGCIYCSKSGSGEFGGNVLDSLDNKDLVVIKLFDYVDLLNEDGEEDEYDEHIWTSPKNLVKMINGALEEIIKVDKDN